MAESIPFKAKFDGNYVQFWSKSVRDDSDLASTGMSKYKMQDWVRITAPGNSRSAHETPMIGDYLERYKTEYAEWQQTKGVGIPAGQTPLEAWSFLDAARVDELHAARIYTVDMLADVDDSNLGRIGIDARVLRQKAKEYLEARRSDAPLNKLSEENRLLKEQMAAMQAQFADLQARGANINAPAPAPSMTPEAIAALVAQSVAAAMNGQDKRGPGRPRKDEAQAA